MLNAGSNSPHTSFFSRGRTREICSNISILDITIGEGILCTTRIRVTIELRTVWVQVGVRSVSFHLVVSGRQHITQINKYLLL